MATVIVQWDGDLCLADREAVAKLYKVSMMSVRRKCKPVRYDPDAPGSRGLPGVALYDAIQAAEDLKDVAARPERTAAALRARRAQDPGDGTGAARAQPKRRARRP